MLFDSHAHMNDHAFDGDRAELIASFGASGVGFVMNAGCDRESSYQVVELANRYDGFYAAVGAHPDAADQVDQGLLEELEKLCKLNSRVRAIGEIGLDYHYEDIPRRIQKQAFAAQMALAETLSLPVIVHEREAHGDGMEIVRAFPKVKGVFHCYSGSPEMAEALVDMGWYIGFTGVLTFKNARKTVQTAARIPLERILLETDCPYMAPEPHRGRRCHPGLLRHTAEKLAQIRGISLEEVTRATRENAMRLFGIEG